MDLFFSERRLRPVFCCRFVTPLVSFYGTKILLWHLRPSNKKSNERYNKSNDCNILLTSTVTLHFQPGTVGESFWLGARDQGAKLCVQKKTGYLWGDSHCGHSVERL